MSASAPTYESTLVFHGLSVTQMKDECCDEVLHALAKKMNRWRNIQLGIDKGVIEGIENDRSTDDEGKRNKLLERWKQKFGHDATYERMVRALMKSERTDLADVVCEELKEILALNIQREPQQTRSYDSTLELHGLESAQMEEVCADEIIGKLAKKMTHWQSIELGVDKSIVQTIDNDHSADDEGKRSSLLERWKQMLGIEATYQRLVQSLLSSLRTDLADVVCEELKEILALNMQQVRSYDSTLELHGLESFQMQEVCAGEVLSALARKMTQWQSIKLGLDKSIVQSIDNDLSLDDEGKRRDLLECWKQMFGIEATYERLVQCLLSSLRTDLADVVCEELKEALARKVRQSVDDTDNEDSLPIGRFPAPGGERTPSPHLSVVNEEPPADSEIDPFSVPSQVNNNQDPNAIPQVNPIAIPHVNNDHDGTTTILEDTSFQATEDEYSRLPNSKSELFQQPLRSMRAPSPPPVFSEPGHYGTVPQRPIPIPCRRFTYQGYSYPSEEPRYEPSAHPPINSANSQLESMVVTVFTSLLNEERNTSSELRMRLRMHEVQMDQLSAQKRYVENHLSDKENRIVQLNERAEEAQTKLNNARKKRNKTKDTVTQKDAELAAKCVELEQLKQNHALLAAERAVQDEKLAQATDRVRILQNDVEKSQCEADIARQEKVEIANTLRRRGQELEAVKDEAKQLKHEIKSEQQQLAIYRQILYITLILLLLAGVVLH